MCARNAMRPRSGQNERADQLGALFADDGGQGGTAAPAGAEGPAGAMLGSLPGSAIRLVELDKEDATMSAITADEYGDQVRREMQLQREIDAAVIEGWLPMEMHCAIQAEAAEIEYTGMFPVAIVPEMQEALNAHGIEVRRLADVVRARMGVQGSVEAQS